MHRAAPAVAGQPSELLFLPQLGLGREASLVLWPMPSRAHPSCCQPRPFFLSISV